MAILNVSNLKKQFAGVKALKGVSLSFPAAQITGVIGPNGSGKTTLINALTGMIPLSGGSIIVNDDKRETIRSHEVLGLGMTRTFQTIRLFGQMSVLDNILVALQTKNPFTALGEFSIAGHAKHAEQLLKRFNLADKRGENAENLSYGQRKLLEVARALATDANVYFFDEPFAGLSPAMREIVADVLCDLRENDKTVILIEHNMDVIRALCDNCIVLDAGNVLAEGKPVNVLSDKKVIEAYLGT